jgi:hypothetical protein
MNTIVNGVDRPSPSEVCADLHKVYPHHHVVYIGDQPPPPWQHRFQPPLGQTAVTASPFQVLTSLYAVAYPTYVSTDTLLSQADRRIL